MFDWRMDASPYARKVLLARANRRPQPEADLPRCPKCGKYFTHLLKDPHDVDVAGWRCFDRSHWHAAGLQYPPDSEWQYTRQRIHFPGEE
jgi:hypothetical protein